MAGVLELFSGFSILSFIELCYLALFLVFNKFISKKKANKKEAWVEQSPPRNWHLKFVWLISIGMSCLLCIILIVEVRRKIPNSRVIAIEDHGKITENVGDSLKLLISEEFPNILDHFSCIFIHSRTHLEKGYK